MAFGVEAVMPTEFLVPSLRIQVEHRLNEKQSEQARAEGLLRLEEERLNSLNMLEHEQQVRKAFVDRHRRFNEEKFQEGKPVLVFQTRSGLMPGKLRLWWVGPYRIMRNKDSTYSLGTLTGERLAQPANSFRMKPYYGKMPLNPFLKDLQTDDMEPTHIGGPLLDPFQEEPLGEPCRGT